MGSFVITGMCIIYRVIDAIIHAKGFDGNQTIKRSSTERSEESDSYSNTPWRILLHHPRYKDHLDENLIKILSENNILVITYPPYTSHIFQVLDKLLFGVLKNIFQKMMIANHWSIIFIVLFMHMN